MYKKKFKKKKKRLYSKEYNKDEEIIFMGIETQDGESDEEGKVDLEVELISSLEEL